MKNRKTVCCALLVALAGAGCAAVGDDPSDPALDEEESAARLPEPAVWRVQLPALSADEQRRQIEVDRYIRDNIYRGYRIADTTQLYSGDLIDWVDPNSVPGSQIEAPPPIPPEELETPPGVELQPSELDEHPELRGPAGTIPIVRPDFAAYVRGETADASPAEYVEHQHVSGQPAGTYRLYAGYGKTVSNTTVASFVDQSIGAVQPGTFSLIETATSCDGWNKPTTMELVGAVVARDLANLSDSTLRLRVEFLTAGESSGPYVGGWDGAVAGFVPYAGRPYGPNVPLTPSLPAGAQYESMFKIQNFSGNWWVAHNGNWLGYYPGYLFDLMHYQGCKALWYGEVYDPTPADWTWTDMGSGYWASWGYPYAAYVRDPHYVSGSYAYYPEGASPMWPQVNSCYTLSSLWKGASPWDIYFYLGGQGGNAYGCD